MLPNGGELWTCWWYRRHGGGKGVAGVVVTLLLEDAVAELDEVLLPALEDSHCGTFSL